MIPMCPVSAYTRTKKFAVNEWNRHFGEDFVAKDNSWTSLVRGGQAMVDPEKSYRFFSSPTSQPGPGYLMEGDSRDYHFTSWPFSSSSL
jgi:endoglucanase Acf2